jgi:hypothetical protein
MRLKEFVENTAMDATIAQMKKVFGPERKSADNAVRSAVRSAEMGKGDADVIKSLIDKEQAALSKDADIAPSAERNIGMLKRALAKTGSEQEIQITKRMGNKIEAGDGIEIDLDKVDVQVDPATKKSTIKPKGTVPGAKDPKDALKPGQKVELS